MVHMAQQTTPHLREQVVQAGVPFLFEPDAASPFNVEEFEECIAWDIEVTGVGASLATVSYLKGEAVSDYAELIPNGSTWVTGGIANLANIRGLKFESTGEITVNVRGLLT